MENLRGAWKAAFAEYRAKRAYSDALPSGADDEDEALDAYCEAMDKLIETPAPDLDAVSVKFEMAIDRCQDFSFFDCYAKAIAADLRRLAGHDDTEFDPLAWIERAKEAGATMFVRGEQLWIGALLDAENADVVNRLTAELDDAKRDAVRDALAARGLICEEE